MFSLLVDTDRNLQAMAQDATEVYAQVIDQLSKIIRSFLKSHPACFILQGSWSKYEINLKRSTQHREEDHVTSRLLERLSRRNAEFSVTTSREFLHNNQSPRQQLIAILDGADGIDDFFKISSACLAIVLDRSSLVITVVDWASTPFRGGDCNLYLAVRLLRRWHKLGITKQESLLTFLSIQGSQSSISKTHLYKLYAELVRSKTFSVGNYLQWLIARGALTDHDIQDPVRNSPWCLNSANNPRTFLAISAFYPSFLYTVFPITLRT